MIDSFSKFIKGVVINNKEAETIIDKLYYEWICNYRIQKWDSEPIMEQNSKIEKYWN